MELQDQLLEALVLKKILGLVNLKPIVTIDSSLFKVIWEKEVIATTVF